ncbi:MAG: OFA family MFS transporter [Candidatus Cloacimonetes bacterium]|nr:OFA family MFS transporter [Candidatus Cloacimonadota bacterium]MBS3766601.1 OFA family MFS transporter [Candidatus Cloacimonadota bacterium]
MAEKKVMNRNFVVFGAILIQLCLGAIYAWSVFTKPLVEAGWTRTQTQAVFAAGLALFAIVMVIAGRIMPKIGPKKLAIAGGIVLGLGYLLAGLFAGTNFWLIFIFVGIIGGSGIGLAYVVPIAVGMRWFPDKKGLITGLAVAGFGFGALLWVKLAGTWGGLIANLGLSNTFTIYGIIFFLAVVIGSIWMVYPAKGWKPKDWVPTEEDKKHDDSKNQIKSKQMLKTPQFYMILLTFAFGASAGLMSIGLMKLFPMQALQEAGLSEIAASGIAGTAMAVFFSLANGLGRIAWGAISDKLGRKKSIIVMMASQGVFVIIFQWIAGIPALLYIGAALIGFNFGGNFALFPTITAETFGTKYIGQNYGWVFLAYGIGGIFGPILGGKLGDMGNFPLAFIICGVLCFIAAIIVSGVKPPRINEA